MQKNELKTLKCIPKWWVNGEMKHTQRKPETDCPDGVGTTYSLYTLPNCLPFETPTHRDTTYCPFPGQLQHQPREGTKPMPQQPRPP